MSTLLMNGKQQCGGRPEAARRAVRKPLVMKPVVPLLTRLLVVALVGGVLALLLGLGLTTRSSAPIAADASSPTAELPRVVVSAKRLPMPARPVPAGTTSKDL